MKNRIVPFIIIFSLFSAGCRKFLDVGVPSSSLTTASVFNSNEAAIAAMTAVYGGGLTRLADGANSIGVRLAVSADESIVYTGATDQLLLEYFRNNLTIANNSSSYAGFWADGYQSIFGANAVLDNLTESSKVSTAIKKQLIGEAKFTRAFIYFYLVNTYGDVPLALTTDWRANAKMGRTPVNQIYDQIIKDLVESKELLSQDFLQKDLTTAYPSGAEERIRPTSAAASAMLARVYLYRKEWQKAETECSLVINNNKFNLVQNLDQVFLKSSKEAIWQLQPTVDNVWNTRDAVYYQVVGAFRVNRPLYMSNFLKNAFDTSDKRVQNTWVKSFTMGGITYYFPFKYKLRPVSGVAINEYPMVLRLAEQYLIRAEARAQQNKLNESRSDLNAIRSRAGLNPITASDQVGLTNAIIQERQKELFNEWGHRWLDLRRTGNIDAVMGVVTPTKLSGSSWASYKQLLPIPVLEIRANPNIVQNPGY